MLKNFLNKNIFLNTTKKLILIFSLFCSILMFNLPTTFAQDAATPAPAAATQNPNKSSQISPFEVNKILKADGQKLEYFEDAKGKNPIASVILQIINFIILSVGSLSFLLIVVGGFLMLSSAGNETQLSKGKDVIKIAIIGLIITLSSYFIVAFVQGIVFGI